MKCAKCNEEDLNGVTCVETGSSFWFCKTCAHILKNSPHETIHTFLGPKKETWLQRNMRLARERRSRGEFLWK